MIIPDPSWRKVCFDLRKIPPIVIHHHDTTTLIISAISISTTKTLSTLARQVQVLPIDKARLGNSESMGGERRCFFIGRRVMEQRLLMFDFFLDSLRFQMFISNLFLETSLGSKGLFLARFTVAMPWAAKTCAADVIVFSWSLCNAKPRLHLHQGSVFECVGWEVERNCKCWANQIPELFI